MTFKVSFLYSHFNRRSYNMNSSNNIVGAYNLDLFWNTLGRVLSGVVVAYIYIKILKCMGE